MSLNLVTLLYLIASVCFIQALKGLSHPTTSIRGNVFGMTGMAIAVFTTAALIWKLAGTPIGLGWVLLGLVVGGGYGAWRAKTVEMTKMPELVAFFHSMIGLAAVFIAIAAVAEPWAMEHGLAKGEAIPTGNRLELFLGAAIGAITFSGSVIAFGKLSGTYKFRLFKGAPVVFAGQHLLNLVLGIAMIAFGIGFVATESPDRLCRDAGPELRAGRADHHSDWRRRHAGRRLDAEQLLGLGCGGHRLLAEQHHADHRRVAGGLVGRDPVLHHVQGHEPLVLQRHSGRFRRRAGSAAAGATQARPVKSGSADDAAFILGNAETVIIVPGYGLAVARAQHAVNELAQKLAHKGVSVKYAIHPVAGRMPGHMNVLLAEAEVPYDQVFEMDEINGEFGQVDVAIVLGANDVVNPAALTKGSPIYGMPILEAYKAKTVIVNKRSMAAGYAGLDNELFYMDKSMMVFGDAKKVVEDMLKAVE